VAPKSIFVRDNSLNAEAVFIDDPDRYRWYCQSDICHCPFLNFAAQFCGNIFAIYLGSIISRRILTEPECSALLRRRFDGGNLSLIRGLNSGADYDVGIGIMKPIEFGAPFVSYDLLFCGRARGDINGSGGLPWPVPGYIGYIVLATVWRNKGRI
jgi:hypothetical protein